MHRDVADFAEALSTTADSNVTPSWFIVHLLLMHTMSWIRHTPATARDIIGRTTAFRHISHRSTVRASSTSTGPPLLSKAPCKLAYITHCKCWKLQPYVHLNPTDPDGYHVKGSLDPIVGDGMKLDEQFLEIGEAHVSKDGLLHPDTACM